MQVERLCTSQVLFCTFCYQHLTKYMASVILFLDRMATKVSRFSSLRLLVARLIEVTSVQMLAYVFDPEKGSYYHETGIKSLPIYDAMSNHVWRAFSQMVVVTSNISNSNCVYNCTVLLYKLMTQLKYHLSMSKITFARINFSCVEKSPEKIVFLRISIKTAIVYTFSIFTFTFTVTFIINAFFFSITFISPFYHKITPVYHMLQIKCFTNI